MNKFEEKYNQLNLAQKEAVDTIEGPVVVVAGPGTGKTQILTLRIANILKNAGVGIEPENILALTFTNAGVQAMKKRLAEFIGSDLAYRVGIFTFHSFAEEQIKHYPDFFPNLAYSSVATDVECLQIIEKILKENDFTYLKTFSSETHYVKDILSAINELKKEGIDPELFMQKIEEQGKNILADEDSYYKRATKKFKKGDLKPQALKPVEKNKELQQVYSIYQEELKSKKLYDYSDMILALVDKMENDDEFLSILQEQYQYILVDEHQDTNEGQNRIISALIDSPHLNSRPNIFTVGDDKQAIYRFQGASVENFLLFKQKFADVKVINLTDNYRSTQNILDISHSLIEKNESGETHQKLESFVSKQKVESNEQGVMTHCLSGGSNSNISEEKNKIFEFSNFKDELFFIAKNILEKNKKGVNFSEMAVMYRNNSNLFFIQEIFEKMQIPFVVASKLNVLDDVEIKKLLLLIRVIFNPRNSEILGKVLFFDFFKLETSDLILLFDLFQNKNYLKKRDEGERVKVFNKSLLDLISDENFLNSNNFKNYKSLLDFSNFLIKQKLQSENISFIEFFENLINESGFLQHILTKPNNVFLLAKLERIFDEVKKNVKNDKNYSLEKFVNYLDLCENYNLVLEIKNPIEAEGVNLMTAHSSKGLEFDEVYITNAVHGLWGGKRKIKKFQLPIDSVQGDDEDERRLFYVALTRAKRNITITYSNFDWNGREKSPSVFLSQLDFIFSSNKQEVATHCLGEKEKSNVEISFSPKMSVVKSILDLDYIREKFLNTQLSVSALNNYFQSPILYFFRNLIRLPSGQSRTLIYGSLIHDTLDKFLSECSNVKKVLSKERLLEIFYQSLSLAYVDKKDFDSILEQGKKNLMDYYDFYSPTFNLNLKTEKAIKRIPFKLDSGEEIFLQGVIDKFEFDENSDVQVVDYKTGKTWSDKTKEEKEILKRQVVFYKLLLDNYQGGKYRMKCGVLDFVEKNRKTGEYEREYIDVYESDVENLKIEINQFAKDILSGEFLNGDIENKVNDREIAKYLEFLRILQNGGKV